MLCRVCTVMDVMWSLSACPQVFSSGGACTLLPSFLGVHPFIEYVPVPNQENERS
jgi:hypothetical protein